MYQAGSVDRLSCREEDFVAKILEFMEHRDRWIEERYDLVRERMDDLVQEDQTELVMGEYLGKMARFLHDALRVYDLKTAQMLEVQPLEKQRGIHDKLYGAPIWQKYGTLSDACWNAGEEWGPLLWALSQECKLAAGYACAGQRFLLTITVELYLQVYQLFEMEHTGELHESELLESVRQAVYSHFSDYSDVIAALVYHEQFYPGDFHYQLLEAGAEEMYGLYRLGGQVDEAAVARSQRLSSMDEEMVAWREDRIHKIVSSLQNVVEEDPDQFGGENRIAMVVPVGFESWAQILYHHLTEAGFTVVCLRSQETLMARIGEIHELDQMETLAELPLFWDRGLKDRRITEEKNAWEAYKDLRRQLVTMLCFEDDEDWKEQDHGSQNAGAADGIGDGESTIRLALSQKQEHLYTEFIEELRKLRTNN